MTAFKYVYYKLYQESRKKKILGGLGKMRGKEGRFEIVRTSTC